MKAARAARAVDQIIHKHLQDWDHDGSRFVWDEDGTEFILATYFEGTAAYLTLQSGDYLPVKYPHTFGCTSDTAEEITFWVKDVVEMTLSVRELVA